MPVEVAPPIMPQRDNYDMQLERDPTFGQLAKANFENENLISNVANKFAQPVYEPDPKYDVFDDLKGYEGYADRFVGVESRFEADDTKRRIDHELENKSVMASGGLEGVAAGLLVGFADPSMLVPIGGAAYKTYRTSGRILEGALKTGLMTGTVVGASELALQSMQETRTPEESVANVAGATLLGGVIGGAAGAFGGRAKLDKLGEAVDKELTVPYRNPDGSVGAMAAPQTSLSDEALKSAAGLEKLMAFQDPTLRMANSPSKIMRQMNEKLAEMTLSKNKNVDGIASEISVENRIKGYEQPKYEYLKTRDELFLDYRGSKSKLLTKAQDTTDKVFKRSREDGMLTYNEFKEEIARAGRRGDSHEIPQVAAAAKAKRQIVTDPLFAEAKRVGLIAEDVEAPKTAESYVNRVWDKEAIKADRRKFQDVNEEWLRARRDEDIIKFEKFQKENADQIGELKKARAEGEGKITDAMAKFEEEHNTLQFRASQDDGDIADISYQLVDRVLGTSVGRLSYDGKIPSGRAAKAGVRGPAKERVYNIPDQMVENFIVNDDDVLTESYVRSLAPDIELTKTFGSIDPEAALKSIQEDYSKLEKGVTDAKTLEQLRKAKNADLRDFKAVWDRLRGTFGNNGADDYASGFMTAERTIMNWNYLAMLGGMTISAFTDVARPVMVHGLQRTMGDGFAAMATDWKSFSAAAKDVMEAGTALDMATNTRGKALFGLDEMAPFMNKAESVTGAMAQNFGIISLMAPWNAALKQFAGVMTQSRMLRSINKLAAGKTIPKAEIEYLAANFVDAPMAARIAKQFEKHGHEAERVLIPNARNWEDRAAQEAFRAAVRRDVDRIIVTPGQDKPLWMSKPGLKLLGQFRSFSVASTQRTMLAGLQQRDMAALNGTILSVALGSLTYVLKAKAAGYEPKYDVGNLIAEGVDRSGLLAWLSDANHVAEKVSRGRVGINALMGGPPLSRYASRSALEAVFGPTYGMIGNAVQLTGNALAGDWQAADTHTVRRMMPYNNLFYIRSIFDEAEQNINDFTGAKQ